ncbi:MAG: nucleoside hydrolase, partial [Flavobacteriales bacterium]|nr:nucleoside hydrolase [Flavobacteriales bacterium]
ISFVLTVLCSFAQGVRVSRTVCVDTDCAYDDMIAVVAFLSSKDTEVLCINSTSGALSAREGADKIMCLLGSLNHQGIPVSVGKDMPSGNLVPFRDACMKCHWGEKDSLCHVSGKSDEVMKKSISSSQIKPHVIALGPLTNVASAIQDPRSAQRIKEIVWYDDHRGFNYHYDSLSAKKVLNSGVPIRVICSGEKMKFDQHCKNSIARVKNQYSSAIDRSFSGANNAHHSPIADQLCVLWVYFPQMFSVEKNGDVWYCTLRDDVSKKDVINALKKVLCGGFYSENQIFSHFPKEKKHLKTDVIVVRDEVIKRHGMQEWRAGVLTNELHGHLGIYAVVGMKMGIRAREFFCVGVDDMKITSFTRGVPPQSCLNDGLQVSTGGTFGHGLIHLDNEEKGITGAFFIFGEKKVFISLKPHVQQQIENDIMGVLAKSGGLGREYWAQIRRLALRYWVEMDRYEIFDFSTEIPSSEKTREKISQNSVF